MGDLLALVDPAGTVIDSYSPTFPSQATNVSYGVDKNVSITPLVTATTTARALVRTESILADTWTGRTEPFDGTDWTTGSGGIGYETGEVGPTIAPPVADWKFDTLVHGVTVSPDERGRHDGTVAGVRLTSGGSGKFGESLSFDGDDDYTRPGVIAELISRQHFPPHFGSATPSITPA